MREGQGTTWTRMRKTRHRNSYELHSSENPGMGGHSVITVILVGVTIRLMADGIKAVASHYWSNRELFLIEQVDKESILNLKRN